MYKIRDLVQAACYGYIYYRLLFVIHFQGLSDVLWQLGYYVLICWVIYSCQENNQE